MELKVQRVDDPRLAKLEEGLSLDRRVHSTSLLMEVATILIIFHEVEIPRHNAERVHLREDGA
eukprot:14544675-Alexandrium_andersonii.AAC.1